MSTSTLFDTLYAQRKQDLLLQLLDHLQPIYSAEETTALRIDPINPAILAQRSGRGFVNRDLLETVLAICSNASPRDRTTPSTLSTSSTI